MIEFNFKSQICTTREQSERLLSLGLKKETADMHWRNDAVFDDEEDWCEDVGTIRYIGHIPAWSLHRLFQIYLDGMVSSRWNMAVFNWDDLIDCIENSIVKGYFNKEYLEE